MRTYKVPIQKAKNKDATPEENPRNHPMPKASLASPNPIPLPLVIIHKKRKKDARIIPETISRCDGTLGYSFKKRIPRERTAKV